MPDIYLSEMYDFQSHAEKTPQGVPETLEKEPLKLPQMIETFLPTV